MPTKKTWSVFGIAFLVFSIGTAWCEITRIDTRFAIMVQDMVRHGIRVCPTINGVEYGDYFSPWTFLVRCFALNGRFLNLWTLSLPAIFCGAFTAAAVYHTGEKHRRNLGLLAAGLLFCSVEWLDLFTGFGVDASCMAAAAAMLLVLDKEISPRKGTAIFMMLLVFSFAVRGPLGGVLLGAVVGGYILAGRDWKKIGMYGVYGLLTLAVCAWGFRLVTLKAGGEDLWGWILYCQFFMRVGTSSPFQVIGDVLGSFAPVSILCLGAVLVPRERFRTFAPAMQWAGAFLLPVILMCFPSSVHMRYLVAGLPFAALFAAWVLLENRFAGKVQSFLEPYLSRIVRWETFLCMASVPVIALIWCLAVSPAKVPWGHCAAALILFASGGWLLRRMQWEEGRFFLNILVMVVVVAYPLRTERESSRDFAEQVRALNPEKVYFFEMGPDYEDLKYLWHILPEERGNICYTYDGERHLAGFYHKMYPRCSIQSCFPEIARGGIVIVRDREDERESLAALAAGNGCNLHVRCTGNLGHKRYCALALEKAENPGEKKASK